MTKIHYFKKYALTGIQKPQKSNNCDMVGVLGMILEECFFLVGKHTIFSILSPRHSQLCAPASTPILWPISLCPQWLMKRECWRHSGLATYEVINSPRLDHSDMEGTKNQLRGRVQRNPRSGFIIVRNKHLHYIHLDPHPLRLQAHTPSGTFETAMVCIILQS